MSTPLQAAWLHLMLIKEMEAERYLKQPCKLEQAHLVNKTGRKSRSQQ